MGFFEFVGVGLVILVSGAILFALMFWGACTRRPVTLFLALLAVGLFLAVVGTGYSSPLWGAAATAIVGGAIAAAISGAMSSEGRKARLLFGLAMTVFAGFLFVTLFGMISIIPDAGFGRGLLETLAWVIITPVGVIGFVSLAVSRRGVCRQPAA